MRIYNINTTTPQNFRGHWEDYKISSKSGFIDINKKIYIPDKKESATDIAIAWKNQTGLLPSDWVKKHNPYNQVKNDIQYEIQGCPYLPIDILQASIKLKLQNSKSNLERLDLYTETAKFAAQEDDLATVSIAKAKMIGELGEIQNEKERFAGEYIVNKYLPGFGTKIIKALFENSEQQL